MNREDIVRMARVCVGNIHTLYWRLTVNIPYDYRDIAEAIRASGEK